MKKLYASKNPNKRIHPSPLSFLPSALMALASVLSPDDQLVLSYLLTSHNQQQQQQKIIKNQTQTQNHDQNHSPDLGCSCFSCYKSFWARWDSSPDRHVIHAILDAFEEEETLKYSKKKDGRGKSKKKMTKTKMKKEEEEEEEEAAVVVQEIDHAHHENEKTHDDDGHDDDDDDEKEEGHEKSSVRRFFGWVFGINN